MRSRSIVSRLRPFTLIGVLAIACLPSGMLRAQEEQGAAAPRAVRPADELFWVPTLEQAIQMARANEVPIFAMGYSLVEDRSTYTKFGQDCSSAVF